MKYFILMGFFASLFGCSKKEKANIDDIQPLIVPSNYNESGNLFPCETIKNKDFIICWVHNHGESISYIMQEEYDKLNQNTPNWKRKAVDNLRYAEYFHEFQQVSEEGQLLWISFMNEADAISSSKILLAPELSEIFPEGYFVGTPNRAVGFAISKSCTEQELSEVKDFVSKMYDMHGSPNSRNIFDSKDFLLPESMLNPIDENVSNQIVLRLKENI